MFFSYKVKNKEELLLVDVQRKVGWFNCLFVCLFVFGFWLSEWQVTLQQVCTWLPMKDFPWYACLSTFISLSVVSRYCTRGPSDFSRLATSICSSASCSCKCHNVMVMKIHYFFSVYPKILIPWFSWEIVPEDKETSVTYRYQIFPIIWTK